MFKSKAETLAFLAQKVRFSKIPKSYFFSALNWKNNEKIILKEIVLIISLI